MRPGSGTPFYALALLVATAAAADPRFDVVPAGVRELSGDGCFAVSEFGVRWQNGASMPIAEGVSFDGNSFSISAMTPDSSMIAVSHHAGGYGRLENGELTPLVLPPSSSIADISDDGERLLLNDWTAQSTSLWMDGVSEPLAAIPSPAPRASATALSADASRVGGTSGDESGNDEAVIWDRAQGTLVRLDKLPGHARSRLLALSADGNVAVGQSSSDEEIRAFRWDGGSALLDLGPLTTHAMATNADGSIVVGQGPQGAFIWDAQHGTRLLRDVLEQDYHLDLGGVWLEAASHVSEDGKTIAGPSSAGSAGWRVSLRDERCGSAPPVDLLWHESPSDFERPSSLAVDSQRRVYVSGFDSRNVIRVDGALAQLPPTPAIEVLDLKDDAPPGIQNDRPGVLGVGADDAVYVSAYARQQILRIDPDGSVTVVFDGSGLPPVESQDGPLATSALTMAVAPDGTLFVATLARLLRIDPDGQTHQVLDALDLTQYLWGPETTLARTFISHVAWIQGSLAIADGGGAVFTVHPDGDVLDVFDPHDVGVQSLRRLTPDSHGALWLSGFGLGVRRSGGLLELIFEYGAPEEVSGTQLGQTSGLIAEPRNSLLYTDTETLVRREADGSIEHLLTSGAPTAYGTLQSIGSNLTLAGDSLYWTDDLQNRIVRYELDIAACDNGLDDDADGAADFPTDAGCSSAQDDGEIPEPEAVTMLVAGAVLLAGLDRRRARLMGRRASAKRAQRAEGERR